jgi:sensor histidine kinase YesM
MDWLRNLTCSLNDDSVLIGERRWVKWSLFYGFWTALAVLSAGESAMVYEQLGEPIPWVKAFFKSISFAYLWALFSFFIMYLGRVYRLERQNLRQSLPVHIAASLILPAIHLAIFVLIDQVAISKDISHESIFLFQAGENYGILDKYFVYLKINFASGVILYWMILGFINALDFYRKYKAQQVKTSQLESRLARSQLQSLKMQLHPHFLFNTLNAISTLIHKDPEAADRMLSRLSDLLRITLDQGRSQEVDLKEELEFLSRYLEMEQIRFGDRLSINFAIDPEILDAQVPNLLLQPLVENAIRHGISPHAGPGEIEIRGERQNGMIEIQVRDNGSGLSVYQQAHLQEGIGLSNTRERLHQLYGSSHAFDLRNSETGGLIARIALPFKKRAENENVSLENEIL